MHPDLSQTYIRFAPSIRSYVRARFPRICSGSVEDAVADAFLIACASPDLLHRAHEKGGARQVEGLLKTIAWRCARGGLCRGAGAHETCMEDPLEHWQPCAPNQEIMAEIHLHLEPMIVEAAEAVCPKVAGRIVLALQDRLHSGEDDLTVARRHDVPREYLNCARRHAARRMLANG